MARGKYQKKRKPSFLPIFFFLIILALAVALVLLLPVLAVVMPAIAVTVQSWFIERVFNKYIPQEEEADDV